MTLPLGVLVHGFGGLERGLLAEVDEGGFSVVGAQQQKAAAAQVAGRRMHYGQGKAGGHGGVHGVAARAQRFQSGIGGQVVDADHHAVPRAHRLFIAIIHCALLGEGKRGNEERDAKKLPKREETAVESCSDRIARRIDRDTTGFSRPAMRGYHSLCSFPEVES